MSGKVALGYIRSKQFGGPVCHFTSLQHHLYRLSEEEAEAVFVQPQFPAVLGLAAFGLNALFLN